VIDIPAGDGIGCGLGAEFEIVTDIRRDDIIVIGPQGPQKFMVRALNEKEVKEHQGPKYRVDKGRKSGTISLAPA